MRPSLGANAFEEPTANQRASAVKATFYVLLRQAGSFRRFRSVGFLDVAQPQDGAELFGPAEDRVFEQMA
jgi:hypothetical protein